MDRRPENIICQPIIQENKHENADSHVIDKRGTPEAQQKRVAGYLQTTEIKRKKELIALKEKQISLMEGLPHLHGWKWYKWAREFFDSTNKMNFLVAGNQCSKSSSAIRKIIHWATCPELWPELWKHKPTQFWYMYPTSHLATIEFETKWQQFLPKNEYEKHPIFGWKREYKNGQIHALRFNSGVNIYFKFYSQDAQALQAASVDALFVDEELPLELYGELMMRLSATDGYFNMVFTATLGQEFWRAVMEERGSKEKLKNAAKWNISIYDCLRYDDGTKSHWTLERIQRIKNTCKSDAEVLKRVYGRFVADSGRKIPQYDPARHLVEPYKISPDWHIYAGVDPGSGGDNHPAAICFIAVRPDFRKGAIFKGWRGDDVITTASDTIMKFKEMKGEYDIAGQYYDWADFDFGEIAQRMGEPFQRADKSHDKGEEIINVLLKNNMLEIFQTEELEKLSSELLSLNIETSKKKAIDDFCDAMRYSLTRIPWDWSGIVGTEPEWKPQVAMPEKDYIQKEIDERRKMFDNDNKTEQFRIEQEFEEVNELYDY